MAAPPNINANTPVYLVAGHSGIAGIQRLPKNDQFIKFLPGQVLIATTACGRFNYTEEKNIYKYLKNNASLAQLRGFLSDPQSLKNKLVQNKLLGEKSMFGIYYNDSPEQFPAVNIDIEREVYDGIFNAPVTYKIRKHRSENLGRMETMKKHLVNKNPRKHIATRNPKFPNKPSWWNTIDKSEIPLKYIIGEKPGIYIVSVCQSNYGLGGIRSFGTSLNPTTGKTQATVTVQKEERLTPVTRRPRKVTKRAGPQRVRTLGIGRDPVTGEPQLQPLPGTVLRNTPGSETQGAFRDVMKTRKRGWMPPPEGYSNSNNSNANANATSQLRPTLPNSFVQLKNRLRRLTQHLQTTFMNRIRSGPHSVNRMNTIINEISTPASRWMYSTAASTNQSTKKTVNAARRAGTLYSQSKK